MPNDPEPTPPGQFIGRRAVPVMGTVVSFDVRSTIAIAALDEAIESLHHADRTFSMFRQDSDMARLARGECRLVDCDPDVETVLALCTQASIDTDRYFTTMIDGRLDPTGLVKGWAVERASDLLRAAGSDCHAVNGGGDVQFVGLPTPELAWQVGIVDPRQSGDMIAIAACAGGALATSGTAERGLHIVNPRTGRPASHFASVSITAPNLVDADVLATAAFARGESAIDWIEGLDGIEGLFIGPGSRLVSTSEFPLVTDIRPDQPTT